MARAKAASPAVTDLAALMARLRAAYATGETRTLQWRTAQLEGLVRFLEEREADIAEALASDLGRNEFESWFGDIAPPKGEAELAIRNLRRWMRPRRRRVPLMQQPAGARIQYEPLGVVLVIGPWNYPVNLSLGPMVAALAAGNCVVLKPSEVAPATSRLMAEALPEYLDPSAVAVVEGDGVVTQELLSLGFDHAFFTGGTEIGRKIMAGAANTLTPVILELGGKSPAIVTADCDLDVVARRIAWVKLMNSGQTCIAPDYVLVDNRSRKPWSTGCERRCGSSPPRRSAASGSSTAGSSTGWPATSTRRRGSWSREVRWTGTLWRSLRPSSSTRILASRR